MPEELMIDRGMLTSGAKALVFLADRDGTAEAVPFPGAAG
jgi:hypothetical protein